MFVLCLSKRKKMNKLEVNNFIVRMRKNVNQARVHIINKLVKDIRKLRGKKGTEKQKKQNHRRAERLLLELDVVKKINRDDVSKYALLCVADPSDIVNIGAGSLEEKVKARYAANKVMASKVKAFRTLYPEWDIKLPVILTQLGMQYKQKKKKKEILEKPKGNVRKESNVNKPLMVEGTSSLNEKTNQTEKKGKMKSEVSQMRSINGNNSGKLLENDSENKELSYSENLDRSQRFRLVLRSPDTESEDSDASNSGRKAIELIGDSVKITPSDTGNCKVRRKCNDVAGIQEFQKFKEVQLIGDESCVTIASLDTKVCDESVSETNSNILSKHILRNVCEKGKSFNSGECNKLKRFENSVTDRELLDARNSGNKCEKKGNGIKRKVNDNVGNMKGGVKSITGSAEIRKLSELLNETNKQIQSSNISFFNTFTVLDDSGLVSQKERMSVEHVKKEKNVPLTENSENSDEKSTNEGKGKIKDSFFLTGDDSGSEDDNEPNKWQFKQQRPFGNQHLLSGKKSRVENDRAFQKHSNNMGRFRHERISNFCSEENSSVKEFSGRPGEGKVVGRTMTLNETQKQLLCLASAMESKTVMFGKSAFHGEQKKFMNRKQRRLLERMSCGAATGGAGSSDDHLHPSWEAKRKQKVQILPFQGKKVKFDDED